MSNIWPSVSLCECWDCHPDGHVHQTRCACFGCYAQGVIDEQHPDYEFYSDNAKADTVTGLCDDCDEDCLMRANDRFDKASDAFTDIRCALYSDLYRRLWQRVMDKLRDTHA